MQLHYVGCGEIEDELRENSMQLNSRLSVGGETQILGHFVDGFCAETNTIYQFHGCFYHGCKNVTMVTHTTMLFMKNSIIFVSARDM